MFFKRSQPSDPSPRANGEVTTVAARAQPLEASELRRVVDPATLGFKTTEELHPITGLIGQERALKAIQFGANIKSHDFNMFVLGPPASGKSTAVKAHLGPKAAEGPAPSDWAYVYNFENPNQPKALQLPPGRARVLAKGMVAVDRRAAGTCCRRCSKAKTTRCAGAPSTSSSAPATRRRSRR